MTSTLFYTSEWMKSPLLQNLREEVDLVLRQIIEQTPAHTVPELIDAMRYAVLNGGKRIRALMHIALTEALQGPRSDALLVGAAVECMHAASLILDDLPIMDDATTRRGRPTLHRVVGPDCAVLTAMALVNLAYEILSRLPTVSATLSLDLVHDLAWSVGRSGLITGQWLDLHPPERSTETVDRIHRYKTAILFEFITEAAGRLSQVSAMERSDLQRFGRYFGLAFQLLDDIVDVQATAQEARKDVAKDVRRLTYFQIADWSTVLDRLQQVLNEAHRIATGSRWHATAQLFLEPMFVQVQALREQHL